MKGVAVIALLAACCGTPPATAQTTPPTTDLYGEAHYERVGHLVYGYQRALGAMDDKARAEFAQHAPPALTAHLQRVTAEYDAIMQEHGDVPDARLDAALREVQAVAAKIAAWNQAQGR